MIAGSFGRISAKTARDHGLDAVREIRADPAAACTSRCGHEPVREPVTAAEWKQAREAVADEALRKRIDEKAPEAA